MAETLLDIVQKSIQIAYGPRASLMITSDVTHFIHRKFMDAKVAYPTQVEMLDRLFVQITKFPEVPNDKAP